MPHFSACLDFSVEPLPRKIRSERKNFLISDDREPRKDSIGPLDADYIPLSPFGSMNLMLLQLAERDSTEKSCFSTSVSPGLQKNGDKKKLLTKPSLTTAIREQKNRHLTAVGKVGRRCLSQHAAVVISVMRRVSAGIGLRSNFSPFFLPALIFFVQLFLIKQKKLQNILPHERNYSDPDYPVESFRIDELNVASTCRKRLNGEINGEIKFIVYSL